MTISLDRTKLPQHVAIIMDGNGRWAQAKGLSRIEGHRKGAQTVEEITECAREVGVRYLTLYAFSKENWNRPSDEVHALMRLLMEFLHSKKEKMQTNGIRLNAIGELSSLPQDVRDMLDRTISETSDGRDMVLTLSLSYGGRDEILRAFKKILAKDHEQNIPTDYLTPDYFARHLDTHNLPDPDLVIRTSGEKRISNFLLWQSAYAEYAFVDPCWPEFSTEDFMSCLKDFESRERRFGLTSEQV